jgi:anti-anti-sigma factor
MVEDITPQLLTIRVRRRGAVPVLVLHGELDLGSAEYFVWTARTALAANPRRVVVDMAGVEFLGIAGYRAFALVAGEYEAGACALDLRAPSPAARRVFELLPWPAHARLTERARPRWWGRR